MAKSMSNTLTMNSIIVIESIKTVSGEWFSGGSIPPTPTKKIGTKSIKRHLIINKGVKTNERAIKMVTSGNR